MNLANIQEALLFTKMMLIHKDETWDNDHSLTLLVDDDDDKGEKEAVEVNHSVANFLTSNCFFL